MLRRDTHLPPRWSLMAVIGLVVLGGCASSGTSKGGGDSAPSISQRTEARLARLPDPKVTPISRTKRGNGPVYTVFGKQYRVMDSARGFSQEGVASWYGTKFHGRDTSSGEKFDMYTLTAAHKHLPIPVFARVTNLDNGKSTIVRINDRGPFHGNRIIDLSYAAAVKLDFHKQGTANVRVEVVEPGQQRRVKPMTAKPAAKVPPKPVVTAPATPPSNRAYLVRAGAFSSYAPAQALQGQLEPLLDARAIVVKAADGSYRVQFGPVAAGAEIERIRAVLLTADVKAIQIVASSRSR